MTPFVRLSDKRMKGVIILKKRILPFVLLFAMLLSTQAFAASPRIITIRPAISFNGTTANCRVTVSGNHGTDRIEAVVILWDGNEIVEDWYPTGKGPLLFSDTTTVTKGKTYELTVDVTINGLEYDTVSISGTC